ncbi:hypothetical protein [Agromyces sp. C10]|uniref:hypothetical protein n=1 Tax=Agromyces sp. C10 TaxID=2935077 RepID=UPI00200A079E|nr:hypothetical protein [Agromyces sp. C10]MCK8608887.1 hypothetical protein [Agromyces sp. C10]
MAINKQALVAAVTKFRTDTASAVKFTDADLTASAITRHRHNKIMAARAELLKSVPAEPTAPTMTPAKVLADRAPRTADQVAVAQHEFGIVERLLAAGHPLEGVIRDATPARLDAILAQIEVIPAVLGAGQNAPEEVTRIHGQVFERLVEVGDAKATIARDAQRAYDEQAAWREVVVDAIEGRETGGGLTALFHADPEGFEALMASNTEPVANADTAEAVRKLDRTFGVNNAA